MTTSVDKFDPKRLSLTEFQDNARVPGQKIAFVRYNHPSLGEDTTLMLQTPWISLVSGGISKFRADFHKVERDRASINLPLEEGTEFFKKMAGLNEQFTSESFKKEHFGKNYKKYSMYPVVNIPEHDDDDDDDNDDGKEKKIKYPMMKVKFDLVWQDKKDSQKETQNDEDLCQIKTKIYVTKSGKDGKKIREEQFVDKIPILEEVEKLVRLGCKLRLIIRPIKGWLNGKKEYGIIWKIIKMEVEPAANNRALMQAFYDADAFIDSDNDDEETVELKKDSDEDDAKDDDDEDDIKDDDNDSDVVVEKIKSDDSEDSDDSDDSEDSDNSDSPDIPVRRSKGNKGKSKNL